MLVVTNEMATIIVVLKKIKIKNVSKIIINNNDYNIYIYIYIPLFL